MLQFLIVLIPVLPLAAFVINGLFGRWLGRAGGWLAVACMGGSAAISLPIFVMAFMQGEAFEPIAVTLWQWMAVGGLDIQVGFRVDQLSALMLLFVTLVSFLVYLYSMGYMAGDPGFNRFFAYLGLFNFSMLVLVLADSLPLLFVGWEGVGLCSYLLIGYYLSMPGAPDAGKKAFIVNRIGDFGFLVAMMMLFFAVGSLNIQAIVAAAADEATRPALLAYGGGFVTILTLALFLGCTGKSAQIPLFTWLPDAMAGPTPVSALIHAATMVTAGVYLVVRLSALFVLAPATMMTIAVIGAATAFVAGTIALTQKDIKKVLAYSTVSQLGFMFLACGIGAFVAGIFHVFTHSFFKACLFLGAGSVIHAAHHIQDLEKMGGLKRAMPVTRWTFLIACAAIAGLPPLAGFISKDDILWRTFATGSLWLWGLAVVTALMTAYYAFRVYFLTFEGKSRLPHDVEHHVHESPWTMTVPLAVLAIGAIGAGLLNLPELIHHGEWSMTSLMLAPVIAPAQAILEAHRDHQVHVGLAVELAQIGLSVVVALVGVALAWHFALRTWPTGAERLAHRLRPAWRLSAHRWWWDDIYMKFVAGGVWGLALVSSWFDRWVIDGLLHTVAGLARLGGRGVRQLQNGQPQLYALVFLLGVNIVILLILWL